MIVWLWNFQRKNERAESDRQVHLPVKERYENEDEFAECCGRLIVPGWLEHLRSEADTDESFMGVLCDWLQQLVGSIGKAKRVWQPGLGTRQCN